MMMIENSTNYVMLMFPIKASRDHTWLEWNLLSTMCVHGSSSDVLAPWHIPHDWGIRCRSSPLQFENV